MISPGQPYRCRECQVRFHVFKTIPGRPFFWIIIAFCLVLLLFSYQVISRMELQGPGDSMVEEMSKGPGAGQHAAMKEQGGQRGTAVKQSQFLAGTSKVTQPKPEELSAGRSLKDIIIKTDDNETRIMIQAGDPIDAYEYFSLNFPKRLVVDLIGKWQVPKKQRFEVKSDMVKGVRLGHHPDRLRIVVDLSEKATNSPVIKKIPGELILIIPEKYMD